MARLPQPSDMARLGRTVSPGIRVGAIDYSAEASGAQQIAKGVQGLADAGGKVLDLAAKADSEIDEYETRKRLLDFKLASEMELEAHKRAMPQGGAGYAEAWSTRYRDMAAEFVGEGDKHIPSRLRNQVGLLLKSHETTLGERAQRDEWAERDRTTIEGLEQTLGQTRSFVEADPSRRDEMAGEGRKLIDASMISPAAKDRLHRHYAKELDKTAVIARLMKAQTAEEYKALEKDLAPHRPDRGASTSTLDFIKREEGDKDAGWDYRQYSGPYGVKRGKDERLTLEQAEGRLKQEVGAVEAELDKRLPGLTGNQRAALTSLFYNIGTGKGRLDQVAKLIESGQADKVPAWIRQFNRNADGGFMEGLAARRTREAALFAAGGGAVPDGETYAGPYGTLSLSERRAFVGQIETQRRKMVGEVEKVIKDQMGVAADGYAPPDPIRAEIEKRVTALGDPMLAAQYQTLMQKVDLTQSLNRAPPAAIDDTARRMRDAAAAGGATKEQEDAIKHVEKVGAAVRKAVNDNPLGHAHRIGLDVPMADGPPADGDPSAPWSMPTERVKLEQLNFGAPDIDAQLARRMAQAKGVGRYYGQNVQAFTPNERDALKDVLARGGEPMLTIMGKIARAAGDAGVVPDLVMKEFTKDAPEVAMVGEMVANNADRRLLDTAAKAFAWKTSLKETFKSTVDRMQADPALGEAAEVLKTSPTRVDSVRSLANLLYEYEARHEGKADKAAFDPNLYKDIVARVMGEVKDTEGVSYGGIGTQGGDWFDGKSSSKVQVPAGLRSDSFDGMIGALRTQDLTALGLPLDGAGQPLTLAEVQRATWVSIAPGRYAIQVGQDADGTKVMAGTRSGQTFVADVRPLLDTIRQRRPDIFMGFNSYLDAVPKAEPDTGKSGLYD